MAAGRSRGWGCCGHYESRTLPRRESLARCTASSPPVKTRAAPRVPAGRACQRVHGGVVHTQRAPNVPRLCRSRSGKRGHARGQRRWRRPGQWRRPPLWIDGVRAHRAGLSVGHRNRIPTRKHSKKRRRTALQAHDRAAQIARDGRFFVGISLRGRLGRGPRLCRRGCRCRCRPRRRATWLDTGNAQIAPGRCRHGCEGGIAAVRLCA